MIGQRIVHYRMRQNLYMFDLAKRAGTSITHLQKIEENKYPYPSVQCLENLSHELNISVQSLLGPQSVDEKETELDDVWLEVLKEAMESGVSKEHFKAFLEDKKNEKHENLQKYDNL
ncbi:helix-turn-helix domain-containing protein [Alteribacillus bidgolensis]|uniref:XRE family transcriptional regulator, master regulator for biofilm formation n=1 Tax=Alteribacillus bidgolensis TaxID=930129 RepID=A0A1G8QZE4_9BACI|nr:helix-turn-helix domain-containing protein [Alteribacillus bidgolensis]SDJ10099.1 XRE family transcriptional regulator, master regulator for biofilm formation [Alteribacillus bidgolensis]